MKTYSLLGFLIGTSMVHGIMKHNPTSCKLAREPCKPASTCEVQSCPSDRDMPRSVIEFKAGYFFFSSSNMRKVYDRGGLDLQLSGAFPIYRYLRIYGSVEYMEKSGRSLGEHERTSFWALPLSLGLQPVFPVSCYCDYYFTLGPRYVFAWVYNHFSTVPKHIKANNIGGFANTGFQFIISKHFLLDIFAEYSYVRLKINPSTAERQNVQSGGYVFGGALGYAF
ncbi:MAG TPA: hypothetical protein VHK67_02415 [Rhabdochlamydiaceae bacterium]|jgi:hypothetical protein|nr:hypothetical protein [Rhabdochlamydiaceae bacterium]